jgi:hypothetical protein
MPKPTQCVQTTNATALLYPRILSGFALLTSPSPSRTTIENKSVQALADQGDASNRVVSRPCPITVTERLASAKLISQPAASGLAACGLGTRGLNRRIPLLPPRRSLMTIRYQPSTRWMSGAVGVPIVKALVAPKQAVRLGGL